MSTSQSKKDKPLSSTSSLVNFLSTELMWSVKVCRSGVLVLTRVWSTSEPGTGCCPPEQVLNHVSPIELEVGGVQAEIQVWVQGPVFWSHITKLNLSSCCFPSVSRLQDKQPTNQRARCGWWSESLLSSFTLQCYASMLTGDRKWSDLVEQGGS